MKLDISPLKNKNKEYDFVIPHPRAGFEEVKFYCKASGVKDDFSLIKKHTPPPKFHRGKQLEAETNWYEVGKEKFIRTVVNWEGIESEGVEVQCSEDAKIAMYDRYSDTICQEILDKVKEQLAAEVGMDLGN